MAKLTKKIIENTPSEDKDILLWDGELKGFGCKITPKGKRIYLLYYRTKDGRQRKPIIGQHNPLSCEQARDIARRWLNEVAEGGDPSATKQEVKKSLNVSEFMELYIDKHIPNMKQKSAEEDIRLIKNYITPNLGKIKLTALTKNDIAKLHASLREKSTTANRIVGVLSRALNLAENWNLRPDGSNPCRYFKKYPERKKERFLSIEELGKLSKILYEAEINRTELDSVIAAIRLLIFTGCRLMEILTLKWQYVDFANHCLRLPDSKTGAKTVYLAPVALEILSKLDQLEGNPYVIIGKIEGSHLINLHKPWFRIRKLAGLDDVRMHDLRHSFASIGAASGLSLPIIGALLGHTQAQTTARYAHLIGDPLREAASVIGTSLEKAMKNKN
jgi:integrase